MIPAIISTTDFDGSKKSELLPKSFQDVRGDKKKTGFTLKYAFIKKFHNFYPIGRFPIGIKTEIRYLIICASHNFMM